MFRIITNSNGRVLYSPDDVETTKKAIEELDIGISVEDANDPTSDPITRYQKEQIQEAKQILQNPYMYLSLSSNSLPAEGSGTEELTVQAKNRLQIESEDVDPSNADNVEFSGEVSITVGDNLYNLNVNNGSTSETIMTPEPSGSVLYVSIKEESPYESNSLRVNVK